MEQVVKDVAERRGGEQFLPFLKRHAGLAGHQNIPSL
jgi:hypothetical protein